MYTSRPGLVLGFHGCDKKIADKVINSKDGLILSRNSYDWLGHGVYFWEHSPERAEDFVRESQKRRKKSKNPIDEPTVIGAVIDLGYCLDLIEFNNLDLLRKSYLTLESVYQEAGWDMPQNTNIGKSQDLLQRDLDCLVIETLHKSNQEQKKASFDSVRGVFWEGGELYPNAGFQKKNHIQLCIRNPNCIKGYFRPRKSDEDYSPV